AVVAVAHVGRVAVVILIAVLRRVRRIAVRDVHPALTDRPVGVRAAVVRRARAGGAAESRKREREDGSEEETVTHVNLQRPTAVSNPTIPVGGAKCHRWFAL